MKLAALLLVFALPACAEERQVPLDAAPRPQDVAALRACLASGSDCAMSVDNACQGEFDATSTLGMLDCGRLESAAWDRLLSEALGREIAVARDMQAERMADFGESADRVAALRQAQTAWGAWARAKCDYEALDYEGGTLAPVIWQACILSAKEGRLLSLQALMEERCDRLADCPPAPEPWPDPILPPPP